MHHRARDITGLKSHYLTALHYHGSDGKKSLWVIKCHCGKEFLMSATEFLKGRQKSCGCMRKKLIGDAIRTHGKSGTPLFAVWHSMKQRCENPNAQAWENYGGRGIRVCTRWSESFEAFQSDMGSGYRKGLSLDRIDVDKGYYPENCRWVSSKKQNRNKRSNREIDTPAGKMLVSEAAELSGIGVTTLLYRVNNNCPVEALFSPPDPTNRFTTY